MTKFSRSKSYSSENLVELFKHIDLRNTEHKKITLDDKLEIITNKIKNLLTENNKTTLDLDNIELR